MDRWFINRLLENSNNFALVCQNNQYVYSDILDRVASIEDDRKFIPVTGGVTVEFYAQLIFSIINNRVVVLASDDRVLDEIGQYLVEGETVNKLNGEPGLVLVTSGTTGKKKVVLHNARRMLDKFSGPMQPRRVLSLLLPDHIGGINTIFYTLCCGGTLVVPDGRSVDDVCRAIEKHRVQILPASPSLLNAIIFSRGHRQYDLSSLTLITYGTEPMTQNTLDMTHFSFPDARLLQTYGSSEMGIVKTKSESNSSLWLKIDDSSTRVIDNTLWVKSPYSMVGYLDDTKEESVDGWINTHDLVEVQGDYLRFVGRDTDVINVGGLKVFPAEIENVIGELEGVEDVLVRGETNLLLGQIVSAKVKTRLPETQAKRVILKHCMNRLERYKVPARIEITTDNLYGERYKKAR